MKNSFIFLLFLLSLSAFGQTWQQEVNSTIKVELDPATNTLTGEISIDYHNNSPDELEEIYIHLWPNAFSNKESAYGKQMILQGKKAFYLSGEEDKGGISALNFRANGISAPLQPFENYADVAILRLNEPLKSGEQITLKTPFIVKLPKLWSRMGVENNIYHITQWYPKPAVYDKNGWHPMPNIDQGEYYSDFGSFDVEISVPSNFLVAATGVLQNQEEKEWLSQLSMATKRGITNGYELEEAKRIKQRQGKKTVHFKQDNIHDFAWFASDQFFVLEDTIEVNNEAKTVQSFFSEDDVFIWEQANDMLNYAISFFSENIGQYPYENYKAVCADISTGGGMEYPMLTVVGKYDNDLALKKVLTHEVGHSWFQGVLASNEREFAWLDEGLTSFYEEYALAEQVGAKTFDIASNENLISVYNSNTKPIAIETRADHYHPTQYGIEVYHNGAKAINYLREYLGQEEFEKGIKHYFSTWKFKHPYPEDLKQSFAHTTKNLDWLFKDIIQDHKPLDYALHSIRNNTAIIENKGEVTAPFPIDFLDEKDSILTTQWVEGFTGKKTIELNAPSNYKTVSIFQRPIFIETTRANNARTVKNQNARPLKIITPLNQLTDGTGSIENNELFVSPIIGWNAYDKFMVGGMITNTSVLKKPLEYQIMPLFSPHTKDVLGLADIRYHINSKNENINSITPYIRARHFNYESARFELDYYRSEAGVKIKFPHLKTKPHFIDKEVVANVTAATVEPIPLYDTNTQTYIDQSMETSLFYNLNYTRENDRHFNPNKLTLAAQGHKDFAKVSATYQYRYDFAKRGEFLSVRAFAGSVLAKNNEMPFTANFSAIGRNGANDYDFSSLYFYRDNSSNILNNAWTEADGGLKLMRNYANNGDIYGDNLFAINANVTIPVALPFGKFHAYSDVALLNKALPTNGKENIALYDAGISYQIGDFVQLYYPLLLSNEFKPQTDVEPFGLKEKLVFSFNFNPLDIKQTIRKRIK